MQSLSQLFGLTRLAASSRGEAIRLARWVKGRVTHETCQRSASFLIAIDVPAKAPAACPDRKEITLTFQTTYTDALPDPSKPLPDPHSGYLVSNISNQTSMSRISQENEQTHTWLPSIHC